MRSVYGYALALSVGFGCAWYVQGLRWETDVKDAGIASANATVAAVDAINASLIQSRAETESIRSTYLSEKDKANREIDDLERRVTAGPERLYIKAKCPAGVPGAGTDASGTGSGAAELDATSTRTYLALERGLSDQYRLLQFCQSELKKRSAPSK